MKPRIFIGSSSESINIAYAIQENLDYDAEVTVWSQGIFKLSSNTIDDLLKVLDNCDYGIFIFSPDDVVTIREKTGTITRDNVIFEIGLFVGKLGKERVFYVTPRDKKDLHIPSDLLPMMPGNYDAERNDGNLKAALGPFCNQIRQQLKDFLYHNLQDIATESNEVKALAINKPPHWQHLMFAQLLDEKIKPVLKGYEEIEKGIIFIPKESPKDLSDFLIHMRNLFIDYKGLANVFMPLMVDEFQKIMGDEDNSEPLEIKNLSEQIVRYCKELLAWEYRLEKLEFPADYQEQKGLLKGLCIHTLNTVASVPGVLRKRIKAKVNGEDLANPELKINSFFPTDKIERFTSSFSKLLASLDKNGE